MATRGGKGRRLTAFLDPEDLERYFAIIVICPLCGAKAVGNLSRTCLGCGVRFELNPEEVEWAISEARWTERSKRATA